MRDASIIEIDLSAVAHNVRLLRRLVGDACAICPIIKADAYGLGATRVAKCLLHAGADMLAVYTPHQAAELVRSAVGGEILILMPVREVGRADDLYRALVCGRLHLSVHDPGHLEDLIRLADRYGLALPLHLEIDTGMSRGGCSLHEVPRLLESIADHRRLRLAGVYTHFASSESDEALTDRQNERFDRLLDAHRALIPRDCLIHAANTCAVLRHAAYHKTMVRVGQGWAGYGVECIRSGRIIAEAEHLQPAVTWSARVVQIKTIPAGQSVGYNSLWTAPRDSVIALLPVGYADGYPYALSGRNSEHGGPRARVAIIVETPRGPVRAYAPVIGAVSMDQIQVDLTSLRADGQDLTPLVTVGTTAELISPDREAPNHLVRLAQAAGTVPYELLCRLDARIRRVYHQLSPTVEVFTGPARGAVDAATAPAAS